MPQPTPQLKAGRQVKRIREILIGRQMETVEQRLDRLENSLQPMPVESQSGIFAQELADIRKQNEESLLRLRDEIDADRLRQLDETRRLAQQIQSIARVRSNREEELQLAAEQRLASWFTQWQSGLSQHLKEREDYLIKELRMELERMRAQMRDELTKDQSSQTDLAQLRSAADQLAAASRAISAILPPTSLPSDR